MSDNDPYSRARPTTPEIKKRILQHAANHPEVPLLVGQLAVKLGWWATIDKVQEYLEDMAADGLLRRTTPAEDRTYGIHEGYWRVMPEKQVRTPEPIPYPIKRHRRGGPPREVPRILVDVDGVIANYLEPTLEGINRQLDATLTVSDMTEWNLVQAYVDRGYELEAVLAALHTVSRQPGYCASLQTYPGARDGLDLLRTLGKVYIVTRPYEEASCWANERLLWLEQHMGIPFQDVISCAAKFCVEGDVFIDDHPDNVKSWHSEYPHALTILWGTTYNRTADLVSAIKRGRSWQHVAELIQEEWPNAN